MNTSTRSMASMLAAALFAVGMAFAGSASAGTLQIYMPGARTVAPTADVSKAAPAAPAPPAVHAAVSDEDADAADQDDSDADDDADNSGGHRHRNSIVTFSSDAVLKAGEAADEVVAIFGNATSDGAVAHGIVAILGDARATGPVGDEVVAVLGNVYLNNAVDKDVVAVGGSVELGPDAKVGKDVVAIGGTIKRDPAATIGGAIQNVALGPLGSFDGLKTWIKRCALMGRPLALDRNLGWAWTIAALFLALYLLLAFVAGGPMQRCVATLEQRPGHSLLAAVIAIPAVPIAFLLLIMTVVGIIAVPVLGLALFCASLFGKAVMLAWIGRRITKPLASNSGAGDGAVQAGAQWSAPLAVLVGGVIVTLLYLVPILGFIVYKVLGFVGFGVVLYTIVDAWQSSRAERNGGGGAATSAPAPAAPVAAMATAAVPLAAAAGDAAQPAPQTATAGGAAAAPAAPVAAAVAPHAGMPRAGFWLRMGALFLDLLLVLVVTHILMNGLWSDRDTGGLPLLWLAVYGAVMWKLKGTTVGGSICGLHLVRLDGKAVDWSTSIMRALGCFLSLVVGGLGFVWIAIDKDGQAWHDKVAGTVVVRTPKGTPIV